MAAEDQKAVRGGRFGRALRSIRTQYSLMTAFFLLTLLAIFYIGGRIVLVHLVREAEQQVKDVGIDIARLATRNADRMRDATAAHVDAFAARLAAGSPAADVVAALAVSRSLLDLRFREFRGETVSKAIANRRLAEVKRLLAETGLSIRAITAKCGFSNPNHLKNLFRRRYGLSMRDWRNTQSSG